MAKRATKLKTVTKVPAVAPVHPVLTFDQQLLRIAGDPSIPVARLKEIAELRSKIRLEDAEEAWTDAMGVAQAEMRPIKANRKNPQTNSKYASLDAVDRALRPIYTKHGFNLSFSQAEGAPEGWMRTVCYVSRGLYTRMYQYDCPISTKGPKGGDVMTATHASGSAYSYSKRYLTLSIFNIAVDTDDDGNAAAGNPPISPMQMAELDELIIESSADKNRFCAMFNIDRLSDLPALRFQEAKAQLMRKLKKLREEQKAKSDFPGDTPLPKNEFPR